MTGQGQLLSYLRRVGDDIETEQLGLSRVWLKQGRQDANESRLPGAVRAEEAEDHAFRHLQVDGGKGRRRSEPLDDAPDTNRGRRGVARPAGPQRCLRAVRDEVFGGRLLER